MSDVLSDLMQEGRAGAGEVVFRARVPARDVVVLTNGRATLRT